jgi:uncharacterized protein (UPF0261 family)
MPPSTTIAVIGTLDSKGEEVGYVKRLIERRGHPVLVIDVGVQGIPAFAAEVPRERVAKAAGADVSALAAAGDRGAALAQMAEGVRVITRDLYGRGRFHGIIGLGGGSGTAVASAAMRALPHGVPRLLVSTKGAGDVAPFVGTHDIAVLYSITDIMGLNPILRRVLAHAAGAIVGMVESHEEIAADEAHAAPVVALSAFGATTPAVLACKRRLEDAGYETLVFHASGAGGRAMEALIEQRRIDAVLDLTTTELADELCGGKLTAGPDRLDAAGRRGIPQVVAPGALDMVNFGPPDSVPARHAGRSLHRHNPATTLMRTTPDENAALGRLVGAKLSATHGNAILLLPLRGFSEYDAQGGVFHDPAADLAFIQAARATVGARVSVVEVDAHINDPEFAAKAVTLLLEMMAKSPAEDR